MVITQRKTKQPQDDVKQKNDQQECGTDNNGDAKNGVSLPFGGTTASITPSNKKNSIGPFQLATWEIVSIALILFITFCCIPSPLHPEGAPTVQHVFYYGWLTCLSTGLGVIPLIFVPNLKTYWIGIFNAIAAGMMIGASYSLASEGWIYDDPDDHSSIGAPLRMIIGALLGLLFILGTKNFLDEYEDLKVGGLAGTNAKRALLVFFVMTLHSFSEGLGCGVSFGGKHGGELGVFISTSLAVHNVPEGLAIAVVLLPRGTNRLEATLWAIATSIPQPLMAVPSFIFVNQFIPFLPIGLGFAAGAMLWVAVMELLVEAIQDSNVFTTTIVTSLSFALMRFCSYMIDEESRS